MIFALLGCFGFAIIFGLNVNMSVAIVAMVNHTAVNSLQPNTTTLNIEDNSVEDTTDVWISFPSELKSLENVIFKEQSFHFFKLLRFR